jgi:hypothetical protein
MSKHKSSIRIIPPTIDKVTNHVFHRWDMEGKVQSFLMLKFAWNSPQI